MKRLFLVFLFLACSNNGIESNILTGDIDGNGKIQPFDASLLMQAVKEGTTGQLDKTIADVNRDGVINNLDAEEILKLYVRS